MKIKRFKNLWAMGLLLFGAILIAFYIAKILFPQFIIGIAETPQIVKIGNIIQSNKILLHLFNVLVGCLHGYILYSACCRTFNLKWKGILIILLTNIFLTLVMEFYPEHYNTLNYISIIFIPFLICYVNNNINKDTFISTSVCFCMDLGFQVMSSIVRNLPLLSKELNVVTILILLIDGFIWRIILSLFFNFKNEKGGKDNGN